MRAFSFLKSGCFQAVFTFLVVAVMVFRPVIPVNAQETAPPPPDPAAQSSAETDAYALMEATVEAPEVSAPPGQADPQIAIPADPAGLSGEESEEDFTEVVIEESAETVQVDQIVGALADNQLALVDEFGTTLSLASAEVAEILAGADPYFSADGITYGWTNAGTPENPSCSGAVSDGCCTYSVNPITDAT